MNTITERALMKRINRKLAKDQEAVRTCPEKSWWYNTLGRHYLTFNNMITTTDIDLGELARELGYLRDSEMLLV